MVAPYWKSALSDIDEAMAAVKRGKVGVLERSAGGRNIYLVEYGEKEDFGRKANYNSACGARDAGHYARKGPDNKPVLLIVGGTHGGELEGIVGVMNLIRALETGADYRGTSYEYLYEHADKFRLLLIPCLNPDGRARLGIDWLIDAPEDKFVYWMQGAWKDGTLCGWPDCKAVHPIKEASGFLGTYFNDDGVNFMHDNFFAPMACETSALLALADGEAVDFHMSLHGGANNPVHYPPIYYVPEWIKRRHQQFNLQLEAACVARGIPYSAIDQVVTDGANPPFPSFNLVSAVHHACGGLSMTYESNMGLDAPGVKFTPEQILDSHMILFEEMFRFYLESSSRDQSNSTPIAESR